MAQLVRNGSHMRPMLAVLKRYGIGSPDKYNRGLWISEQDIPRIRECMMADHTAIDFHGIIFVNGTNMHNQVQLEDFTSLFGH